MDQKDIAFREFQEKKEKFKIDARKAKLDVDDPQKLNEFLSQMGLSGDQRANSAASLGANGLGELRGE